MDLPSELLKNSELLHSVFEYTPLALMVLGKGSVIQVINYEAEHSTGYTREELQGRIKWTDIVLSEDHKEVKNLLRNLKSGDHAEQNEVECRIVDRQGELKTFALSGFHHGESGYTVLSMIDITSQKEQEALLKNAREKAEASDRLKTSFLGNLSHELRTPMNAIIGFATLLQSDALDEEKSKIYLGQIVKGSTDLLHLVDKTILLSRIDLGQLKISNKQFPVNASLKELGRKYTRILKEEKKDIEIRLDFGRDEEGFMINADRIRVMDILGYLIDNAVKFTTKGSITLGYTYDKTGDERKEDYLQFYVKDTGSGIAEDKLGIVFDRFVKLVESNETVLRGAGLGLAISRDLARMMGGKMWAESKPGKGSTFYFRLPVFYARVKEMQAGAPKPLQEQNNWSGITILVAEDMESNYLYIKELLKPTGATVLRARDGIEAVEIFEKHSETDLVLMDILMPRMDGYEATARIKEIREHIPVIAQTAFTFEGEMQDGLYAGCFNDYIMKPFTRDMLIANMKKYLTGV